MFGMIYSPVKFHAHIQIMPSVQPTQAVFCGVWFFFFPQIVQEMKLPLVYHCPLHFAVNFYKLKTCTPRSAIHHGAALYCHVHVLGTVSFH